jgi:NADH-quinone oxidoreductase subunit J
MTDATWRAVKIGAAAGLVGIFIALIGTQLLASGAPQGASTPVGFSLPDLLFYVFAALTIGGAGFVALSRNIIYSALGLLAALMGAGALYVLLAADFVAIAQLLVYIGGVLVLVLFAVMLTAKIADIQVSNTSFGLTGGFLLLAGVVPLVLFVALGTPWATKDPGPAVATTKLIGEAFLTKWLLPFEVASLVLLATLIGAVVMARKELKVEEPTSGSSR